MDFLDVGLVRCKGCNLLKGDEDVAGDGLCEECFMLIVHEQLTRYEAELEAAWLGL